MRFGKWIFLILIILNSFLSSFAAPTHITQDNLIIDQSKNVFFEQYDSNTFSLQLLKDQPKFNKSLVFGGVGQVDLQHWQGDKVITIPPSSYRQGTGFYCTQATIDIMLDVASWSSLFVSASGNHIGQSGPNGNYVYVPHAFVLFGDLKQTPFYLTLGINSIPFGVYLDSGIWDIIPLTFDYFTPQQAPQISLGYFKKDWNLSTTFYKDEVNHDSHFVYNLSYKKASDTLSYSAGLGFLSHLKTNTTGSPTADPLEKKSSLNPNVPSFNMGNVWDVNASLGYKIISITGEYDIGSQSHHPLEQKPSAFGITLKITPKIADKTTTLAISHSQTYHLKNIPTSLSGFDGIPLAVSGLKNSWAATISRPLYKDNFLLGLGAERVTTYFNERSNTYSVEVIAFI